MCVIPRTSCQLTRENRYEIHDRFGLHVDRRQSRWRPVPSQRVGKTSVLKPAPFKQRDRAKSGNRVPSLT